MPAAVSLVFKALTKNDFFRINSGNIESGGGQAYVDFRTSDISVDEWEAFFADAAQRTMRTQGPAWTFSIRNLGANTVHPHPITIYQRRTASVSIASQKLPGKSKEANRVEAWRPNMTSFPAMPDDVQVASDVPDELVKGLLIFIIRDDEGRFWAGWLKGQPSEVDDPRLLSMFSREAGKIDLQSEYELEGSDLHWPLRELGGTPKPWDDDDDLVVAEAGISYSLQKVRVRDKAAARSVRKLYSICQVTGDEFVFQTRSGVPYLEVHHLIPLGRGGADSLHNMVVVSAQAHKMLHYADVSPINLTNVTNNELPVTINGKEYTIRWHPQHVAKVIQHNQS